MVEEYVDKIMTALASLLPADWTRVVLHAAINAESYRITYYVRTADHPHYMHFGEFLRRAEVSPVAILRAYQQIYSWSRRAQEEALGDIWTGYTLTVSHDGRFMLDYEYDPQEPILSDAWRRDHLV